jgi:hypothetical protein
MDSDSEMDSEVDWDCVPVRDLDPCHESLAVTEMDRVGPLRDELEL